jgi:D-alanyl-D-alanine carboxypeptidase
MVAPVRNLLSPANAEDFALLLARRVGTRGAALLSVSVARGAWSGAVGLPEDLPPGPPRFLAYSITKTMIAALVLQLAEEGRLALDAALARWEPGVPGAGAITLRHLLQHTGGLRDYGALPEYHAAIRERWAEPWSFEEFAAVTLARGPLSPPGERFAYSNPGYALLRRIAEREHGESFAAAIAARIAGPLGLRDTRVMETLADQADLVPAYSTFALPGGPRLDVRARYHPGWVMHGVVASTSEDLCAFYERLFAGALLAPASVAAMKELVPVEGTGRADEPGYGLGLMGSRRDRRFGHNGGGPGYSASAFALPDAPTGAVVACATCAFEDEGVAESLVSEALALAAG